MGGGMGGDMGCGMGGGMAGGMAGAMGGLGGQPSDNLYMKGFPPNCDESMLRAAISPYGTITSCKVLPPGEGRAFAAGLVRMASLEEAKWLVDNLNGNIPEGMTQPIEVKYAANSGSQRYAPY